MTAIHVRFSRAVVGNTSGMTARDQNTKLLKSLQNLFDSHAYVTKDTILPGTHNKMTIGLLSPATAHITLSIPHICSYVSWLPLCTLIYKSHCINISITPEILTAACLLVHRVHRHTTIGIVGGLPNHE